MTCNACKSNVDKIEEPTPQPQGKGSAIFSVDEHA